jgi:regulator of sirC expression with transglutaminase-like and TPR domain
MRERKGDIQGAIADLEQLLRIAPNHPQARTARAALKRLRAQQIKAGAGPGK